MGRALAGMLEHNESPDLAALRDAAAIELPAEDEVRRLLEAVEIDADAAVAAARADGDTFEGDELPTEMLQAAAPRLLEAVGAGDRAGTRRYKAVVIRPGRAKGTGRRFYSRKMLEANTANFGGVTCFFNHEDLAKILRRGHGSRDPRDVCGRLQESTWWDPTYTEPDDAKNGRLPGAVMGHVDLLNEAADRVDALPDAFALSICMDPTKIRMGRDDQGKPSPCVEGIVPQSGSLDLITGEAGAGGRLLERLRESAEARYGSRNADLDSIDDTTLIEAARARPGVLAALRDVPIPPPSPEDEVTDVDTATLLEAVRADEAFATQLIESLAGSAALDRVIEAKVAAERDTIRDEASAESDRKLALRDMRDEAHALIEARTTAHDGILLPTYAEDLRERYSLTDGRPTAALDLYDELGADGAVTRSAMERLREAVETSIAREEAKLREAVPTRVRDVAPPPPAADGTPAPPVPRQDPLASRLKLDPDRVRAYQTQGG